LEPSDSKLSIRWRRVHLYKPENNPNIVTGTVATGTFNLFTTPTAPQFDVGWVDLKIWYEVPAAQTGDDTYKIEYSTNGATWNTLLPATTLANAVFPKAARPWAQVTAMDGSWDWSDVASLSIRFTINKVGTAWDLSKIFNVYEIWATVYPLPLPPEASTTMSVQPPVVMGVPANPGPYATGNIFFVDVYGQGFTSMAGYEFTIAFDTSIITPVDAFGYWPWVDVVFTPDDTAGQVNVVATAEPPVVDTGISGNSPLARVYFTVDSGGTTALILQVHKMGQPGGIPIAHTAYDGFFSSPRYLSFTGGIIQAETQLAQHGMKIIHHSATLGM